MKISTQNSFGFIVANHPVLKVTPQAPLSTPPPRIIAQRKVQKKKA
jgi:hypothetical protein